MITPQTILALDPGPVQSALVSWNGVEITAKLLEKNDDILSSIKCRSMGVPLVIEQVMSYGMTVGAEVFDTVFWSGRFAEAHGYRFGDRLVHRMPRMEVKMHLCHSSRAKDGNIRQALIDRFGKPGTKKAPGLLYGVSSDLWAALALGVTWWDQNLNK